MVVQSAARIISIGFLSSLALAGESAIVADEEMAKQRRALEMSAKEQGAGPQSPRDIDIKFGRNEKLFVNAPAVNEMNLCNIHFHKNAEHKGGEFTRYAGNGDGKGYQTGYLYADQLNQAELAPLKAGAVCKSKYSEVLPGDTIELHYVYSTGQVEPGPTLGACINKEEATPKLRVESLVFVAVNDRNALDFRDMTSHQVRNGFYQATDIPNNTGQSVTYVGSTTGPSYNEKVSPFEVTWNVRPKVAKVNIQSMGAWCDSQNVYQEDHAHGVRNLVTNPDLLSEISVMSK